MTYKFMNCPLPGREDVSELLRAFAIPNPAEWPSPDDLSPNDALDRLAGMIISKLRDSGYLRPEELAEYVIAAGGELEWYEDATPYMTLHEPDVWLRRRREEDTYKGSLQGWRHRLTAGRIEGVELQEDT